MFKNSHATFQLKQFMLSRFISALGDQILLFAVPILILKSTGSIVYSGLAFAIEWSPRLFLLPISGMIADRVNVRSLFRIGDGVRAILVFGIATLLSWNPSINIFWPLSVMMAVLAVCHSLVFIGLEATLPRQLPASQMPLAQSMLQSCDQLSQVIGPVIAALMSGWFGLVPVLFLSSIMFCVSTWNAMRMKTVLIELSNGARSNSIISSYAIAIQVIQTNPILISIMGLTIIVNIVYGSFLVLTPGMVIQFYSLPEKIFGYLQTAAAICAVLVFLWVPKIHQKIKASGLGILSSVLIFGGAICAAGAKNFSFFAIGVVLVLASDGMFNVYIRSLRALIIPKEHFGKTTGFIIMVNNLTIPLSGLMVSQLARIFNIQEMVAIASLGSLTLFIGAVFLSKYLLRYQTLMPSLEFETVESRNKLVSQKVS